MRRPSSRQRNANPARLRPPVKHRGSLPPFPGDSSSVLPASDRCATGQQPAGAALGLHSHSVHPSPVRSDCQTMENGFPRDSSKVSQNSTALVNPIAIERRPMVEFEISEFYVEPQTPTSSSNFLEKCHLCLLRLRSDEPIYMYGDFRGFCSEGCRKTMMIIDKKPKCMAQTRT